MPMYTFKRPTDGAITTRKLSFDEYELLKQGTIHIADDDGVVLELIFNPGTMNFSLKDGPSGGWMSKAYKEQKYRGERDVEMKRRERDHVFKTRLIPNLGGVEAHSWADVQDEVRSKKGVDAASTYEPLVTKEKAAS